MTSDFTLTMYKKLLNAIKRSGLTTTTVTGGLQLVNFDDAQPIVILRHDIDRRPRNALKMAQVEAEYNIKSTYYFRHMPHTFKPEIICKIAELGHEIGYHYETLAKAKGDFKKAFEIFQHELADFRKITNISTACMHGRPLSPWDNRNLWQHYDFKTLGINSEPYLSFNYDNIIYLTDTGRSWNGDKYNLRDKVSAQNLTGSVQSTRDVMKLIQRTRQHIMLQTHPERWSYNSLNHFHAFLFDHLSNTAKQMIKSKEKNNE